jgi:ABC-type sugar transport system ATPase subunit
LAEPGGRLWFLTMDRICSIKFGSAFVFQEYALFPKMTVRDTISFGLRVRGVPHGGGESSGSCGRFDNPDTPMRKAEIRRGFRLTQDP